MTTLLAAGTGALALLLALGPGPLRVRARFPTTTVLAVGVLATALLVGSGVSPVLLVLAAVGGAATLRGLGRRRASRAERRRGEAVLALCDNLAAELAAGAAPATALTAAVADWPEFRALADAVRLGADVPGAMRTCADLPGAGQLRLVAAAWAVAHRSGAGLAAAMGLAAREIREDRAAAQLVATELASASATARMLALLPIGVLLLGRGVGGDPVGFLLGTTAGLVCLASGLGLAWSGLFWMQRIADGVGTA